MPNTRILDRLLHHELGSSTRYTKPNGIYADTKWVRDLDIVNELDGHSGCVNALSWSKSGKLLASGSDDQHLNIHTYHPEHSCNPFALTTTVSTGHTANIFSVKFMPNSDDRTVVTCAGDGEIRVFDIEYAGKTTMPTNASSMASTGRGGGYVSDGVKFLSDGDTNTRVFRSHSDRVKRIVTESSPFLFLSCSEDGEVRQWDTRLPSSAYPRPRGARGFFGTGGDTSDVPPPLISYKRFDLDLNTISCSSSQPHYIALGGAHLHCFLHDRRMLGRDTFEEQGQPGSVQSTGSFDDNVMTSATKCVKRFAPKAQQRMKRNETGHITACKISDANPNEMIASWSGDWIYNFDLNRDPDAGELSEQISKVPLRKKGKARESRNRKRKRAAAPSTLSREAQARAGSKAQKSKEGTPDEPLMALRVRYENGQSEDVPLAGEDGEAVADASDGTEEIAEPPIERKRRYRIAKTLVDIRKTLFSLQEGSEPNEDDPTGHTATLSRALGQTVSILEDMDEIMRRWRYPLNPENFDTMFQNTLRSNRDRSRRFVQASGTLSRVLGGNIGNIGPINESSLQPFYFIQSSSLERGVDEPQELFCYDFLKAICLWLESGPGALVEGFSTKGAPTLQRRRPLQEDATIDDIDDKLIPYLIRLASERSIPNLDASRFEIEPNRTLYNSEHSAVLAFARAIKIPFADLSRAVVRSSASSEDRHSIEAQDRRTAMRFWGLKVARGVLMNAGNGINFSFVERAFGGLGKVPPRIRKEERDLERQHEQIDSDDTDPPIKSIGPAKGKTMRKSSEEEGTETQANDQSVTEDANIGSSSMLQADVEDEDAEMVPVDDARETFRELMEDTPRVPGAFEDTDGDRDVDVEEEDATDAHASDSSRGEDTENEDEEDAAPRNFLFRSTLNRSTMRNKVNLDVPVIGPELHYRGAANVRTVKDVNFYGLNDEYVVSGSDSGHLFIWDRNSGELMNILEGDGEVVNVVQGHPYEPMLAVSGIDHTIKIFNSDKNMRSNARKGVGVNNTGESGFSTLNWGGRTRFGRARRPPRANTSQSQGEGEERNPQSTSEPAFPVDDPSDTETEDARIAPTGLSSRRRMHQKDEITSQNDVERRGGNREAFITRNMLAQLAARVRFQRRRQGGQGEGDEGDEGNADENEALMADIMDDDEEGGDAVIDLGDGRVILNAAGGDCNVQ